MNARLTTLIEKAGLRQADVARLLNLSPATVSRMFDGHRELTLSEAKTLADDIATRTGEPVSLDDLVGEQAA